VATKEDATASVDARKAERARKINLRLSSRALPTGTIKLSQVKEEFAKGDNLLDYLGEGGVTSSAPLKLTDFRGTSASVAALVGHGAMSGSALKNGCTYNAYASGARDGSVVVGVGGCTGQVKNISCWPEGYQKKPDGFPKHEEWWCTKSQSSFRGTKNFVTTFGIHDGSNVTSKVSTRADDGFSGNYANMYFLVVNGPTGKGIGIRDQYDKYGAGETLTYEKSEGHAGWIIQAFSTSNVEPRNPPPQIPDFGYNNTVIWNKYKAQSGEAPDGKLYDHYYSARYRVCIDFTGNDAKFDTHEQDLSGDCRYTVLELIAT